VISPSFSRFKQLSRKGNLIAVGKTIPADLETPVSAFLKLAGDSPYTFLLESAEQEEKIGRYSIIGLPPGRIFTARGRDIYIHGKGKAGRLARDCHPLDFLEATLSQYQLANPEILNGFTGGFVGYFGYENVQYFEDIRLIPKRGLDVPDAIFFLCREFVIFDHFRKRLSVVLLVEKPSHAGLRRSYAQVVNKILAYLDKLRRPLRLERPKSVSHAQKIQSNMKRRDFGKKVHSIKNYIRSGDCIQVVLSQRFRLPAVADDFQIYRSLRSVNPSPYMFYFRAGKIRLIGSSPEMLVKKTGRQAELRPIAGTRPRGLSAEEDASFEANLRKSVKEMAEHLMLVDLGRNDLGRVCLFDSVRVKNFARVERYSHVMHLVSDVVGKLRAGKDAFDLLRATFPAGTVTGAPKIRAMQIIDELEPDRRGPYAGCLGYFGFNGDMDMCITIRTLISDSRHIYLQAGAGIVKDSSVKREFLETLNKARALLRAIERRGEF